MDLYPATFAVFGCGLCIENGGDAEPAASVTLRFAKESVKYAADLFRRRIALNPNNRELVWQEICAYLAGAQASPLQFATYPECSKHERISANMYIFLSPALYNVLKASETARQATRADQDFLRDLAAFENVGECPEAWIPKFLAENAMIHLPV